MFSDVVGYTALMQADEQAGVETRARFQTVLRAQHDAFDGTVVNLFGDGALSIFPSSVEAIRCAIEIQRELRRPRELAIKDAPAARRTFLDSVEA